MKRQTIVWIASLAGFAFVLGMYALHVRKEGQYDLEVLFSGLALLVIYVTLLTQQRSTADTLDRLERQVEAQAHLAEVQALSVLRDNAGSRISYLRDLLAESTDDHVRVQKQEDLEAEGITREGAESQVLELKRRIWRIEKKLEEVEDRLNLGSGD